MAADKTTVISATTGRWILLSTILASSMAFIDGSALNVALDALQRDLHANGAQLLWIVNAYLLLLAALILLGGSLGDQYGRKRIFGIGIAVFALASFACGVAPTVEFLIAARVVQGVGGALMVPGSLAIISATFGPAQRGSAIGTWSAFSTLTTIAGPAIGGVFAGAGLWRFVFFINLPLAVVALYSLRHVPETRNEQASHRLDVPGTLLVALGLAGITYGAIQLGGHEGAGGGVETTLDILALALGVIALVAFVFVEARSTHPLVRLDLFRSRTFTGTNAMCVFLYGALSGVLFFLPLNLIQVQGYSATIAGLTLLPFTLMLIILSPLMGRLVDRVGPRLPLTVGPVVVALAFVLLAIPGITGGPSQYWTTYLPGIIGIGLGMGILVAPLTTAVMGAVPSQFAGTASGVNNAVTRSAQVLALAVLGAVALAVFSSALQGHIAPLHLPPAIHQALTDGASKLGRTPVPPGLDTSTAAKAQQAIKASFVDMFRLLALIGAGMSLASGVLAWLLVQPQRKQAAPSPADPVAAR